MPFQVTYSKHPRVFRQVVLRTAGDNQFHICTSQLNLEALVDGDLLGHTIQWEQVAGTTVTLIGANTLTPTFDAVDGTDKVFRCYIDQGTPYEQFAEVTIFKTPVSFPGFGWNPSQNWVGDPFTLLPVDAGTITSFVDITVPPPTSTHGEELGSVTVVEVEWDHPGQEVYDKYISQYKVVENGTEVDEVPDTPTLFDSNAGTGPPTDARFYVGTFATYRIDTYYNINGIEYIRESDTVDFTVLPVPSVMAYNDAVDGMGWNPSQNWHTRTNFRNIVQSEESAGSTGWNPDNPWLSVVKYSNTVMDDESMSGFAWSPDTPWINMTRFDPSGIGSG